MKLSIVIPAHNEEGNVPRTLAALRAAVRERGIPYEFVVVNDNSTDGTLLTLFDESRRDPNVRIVNRTPPGGFGRAIRDGIDAVTGDVVVICMADGSDDPADVLAYYDKIGEGYDCVFGSRFVAGSRVENYPRLKLFVNRLVNHGVRMLFWSPFNDLSNAFKAYRTEVLRDCGPFRSSHFNITFELSLSALIRGYRITQIPIRWYGRTWGESKLKLREMGRRYLWTILSLFSQRLLIRDDLQAETQGRRNAARNRKPVSQGVRDDRVGEQPSFSREPEAAFAVLQEAGVDVLSKSRAE